MPYKLELLLKLFGLPIIFGGWLGLLALVMFSPYSCWLGVFLAVLFFAGGFAGGFAVACRWF